MDLPPAMPLYPSPATSGVRLRQGHPLGSPPVPPLTALNSSSTPFISPPLEIRRGPPSWNPPGNWIMWWYVLWWHRTLFCSQDPSVSGLGGSDPPVSLGGGIPPDLGFLLQRPGRGPTWMSSWVPYKLVWIHTRCQRWLDAQMRTPVGVNSVVHRNLNMGDYGSPPIMSSPTLLIRPLFTLYLCR